METVAGESEAGDLRVGFHRRLKLEFHGSKVTSDAGLLALRDLDDALGLTEMAGQALADSRIGKNNRYTLTAPFTPAAPTTVVVLDMDSSVSPTYGDQEGTAYNGHFGCTCYHPLFVFNQFGDLERTSLRSGNVHSADDWRSVLEPVVTRYRDRTKRRFFRGDAAFALPELYDYLEAEGYKYTIRLKANAVLQGQIGHLLTRPVGRPPKHVQRFYASFSYQAKSWSRKRRVVAKVEWHFGELFPRVGFIVTNLTRPAARVTAFYNQRGTAEQYIKEGKNAVKWTRLSCRSMKANAVRLQLHALAYNLSNFLRPLVLPDEMASWSLTTLREKVVKIGAKVIAHARYAVFQMAEVAVPRDLFRRILGMIDDLRPREPAPC